MKKIILASASPRRIELLSNSGIEFEVLPSNIEENINENLSPQDIVQELAYLKAYDITKRIKEKCLIIGADTIVFREKIFGKPINEDDAIKMLNELNGKWHQVYTGIALIDLYDNKIIKSYEKTLVKMKRLTKNEILNYIKTEEYKDKAGAYGIQKFGAFLIEKINGCYFNVVGLPIAKLYNEIKKLGVDFLEVNS